MHQKYPLPYDDVDLSSDDVEIIVNRDDPQRKYARADQAHRTNQALYYLQHREIPPRQETTAHQDQRTAELQAWEDVLRKQDSELRAHKVVWEENLEKQKKDLSERESVNKAWEQTLRDREIIAGRREEALTRKRT